MSIMSAIALYAVIWFMTMFLVLPFRMQTQGEAGDVTPGTPSSAPSDAQMLRKARLVTIIATAAFLVISGIILSEVITFEMIEGLTRGR